MTRTARLLAYALEFGKAFESGDWSTVRRFFSEDAEYIVPLDPPLGGRFLGRDRIVTYFEDILDRVDRRFDSREGEILEGPLEMGDFLWFSGRVTYRSAALPDLVVEMQEAALYRGDLICRLIDVYSPSMIDALTSYGEEYGELLGLRLA